MQSLTTRQNEFLRVILQIFEENNLPPTFSDLRTKLNITNQAIYDQLKRLRERGYITRSNGKARGVRLTPKAIETLMRPPELVYNLTSPASFLQNLPTSTARSVDSTSGTPANILLKQAFWKGISYVAYY